MLSDTSVSRIIEAAMTGNADFAEIFEEELKSSSVGLLNGKTTRASSGINYGVGIRLMAGTNVVYVYTCDKSEEALIKLAKEASAALKGGKSADIKNLEALSKSSPSILNIDPLTVSKKQNIDFLREASDYAMNYDELITQAAASYSTSNRVIHIVNSLGFNKEESQTRIRISVEAVASKGNEKQTGRIAPGTMRGYEFINEYPIIDKTRDCCETAIRMINAGYAPSGKMPVVIGNGFGGVIFHEACGHALESTAVGIKASCFTDKLGQRIASDVVSARDNARIEGEWGSYFTDDTGRESSDLQLIENGICKNYLVDDLGARRMGCEPTGCGRRQDFTYAPTSRMSNTYIENGKDDPKDIIADTEYGLYCSKMGGGSVDTATGEFNFAAEEAFMIRNGKIAEPVRGATLIGKGQEILLNIDRVGNDLELAAGMCGSISGGVPVTVGQPTIRVSSILVGGREA
ncbi:MAG: TldD/PmbA family protein [Clostridiales bacterium]|nr:TldD/PmbA family protein [Clostridiales bacterium]